MSGTLSNLWQRLRNGSQAVGADNLPPALQDAEAEGQKPSRTANKLVFLDPSAEEFDLEDLLRGDAEYLGEGTIGKSSLAVLEGGRTVVVKKLNEVVLPEDEFRKTMIALGAMRHKNLLPLRAYFYSGDEQLLLFDYAPQRSLYELLHEGIGPGKTPLGWETRCRIALGVARAIEYLHAQGTNVFHGNIKSTNVLLTASYDPLVSDYGLTHVVAPPRGKPPSTQKEDVHRFGMLLVELLTRNIPDEADLSILHNHPVNFRTGYNKFSARIFEFENEYHPSMEELAGMLQVALDCASSLLCPLTSEVRGMIEGLAPQPRPNQLMKVSHDFSKRTWYLPHGGVSEVSDRVYVFDYCLSTDWSLFGLIKNAKLKDDNYKLYMKSIFEKLQFQFPAASFMVQNFGEQKIQSEMAEVLSEYGITVMELPQNCGGCPIPRLEIIHNLLRSADEWLSSETKQNVLLMHCERDAWPVLAFMLASLLLYRKKQDGEQETLDRIYKKGVHGRKLLRLMSTLNPLPSQLRYLHYISIWNAGSYCPPADTVLGIKCVILSFIPHLDAEGGCRPFVKITGRDPSVGDQTPKVLFSTTRRSEHADGERVKLDIQCNVQGDVVLECMNLDADLEHAEPVFRAMFNTAFILDSVLKLELEDMDIPWDRQGQYPEEFKAEIVFLQVDAATLLARADFSSDEEENENQIKKSKRKVEPEELPPEGRAVHSISYDADTIPEENEVPELPVQSNTESTLTLQPMLPSLSESSDHSAVEGKFVTFELATKSPFTSRSFELDQQYGTTVERNGQSFSLSNLTGENTESVRGPEKAAVTEANMEVTSASDSASSSAVHNGSMEGSAAGVSNSAQFPDVMLPKQEKLHQQDNSSSSTSMSSGFNYDVFLNFRGPDTRLCFTNFLYTRLSGAGIHTFKDDEDLRVGEVLGPELLKAIIQSKIAILIFSKGYASSIWCLDELVQVVECCKTRRQKVIPIFYDVTPAEVRHQSGSYEDAFLSHEDKFGANIISKWKAALNYAASLKGWDNSKKNRAEGELVEEIVQEVISELKLAYLLVTDCLVGVENHVKEIDAMMCSDSEDTRILGIYGMGGVGKTTLAKIIYNRLSHRFEACCFLSNIRGSSEQKGIKGLQKQLIFDILKIKWSNISNVEEGIKMIKERLCGKKVLLLLDDVDQMTHWDALIGSPAWFGLGSRIIITSRNRDIVEVREVCYPYELISMNFNQSLQLFCKHAFGRDYPPDDYVAFSTEVAKSTGGLPLALEAIGKLLSRRSTDVWDVILEKSKQVPLSEVKLKLKISYDALDDWQKHIFLDIACFFSGFDQRRVLHSWKDLNLFPEEGLEVLQRTSLIKIGKDNKLWMHEQLRGLGRDIVRQECDTERRKKIRLRNRVEGLDVVMEPKGTIKMEALCRKFDPQLLYNFANEEVGGLLNLRYAEVRVFHGNCPSNYRVSGN